VLRLNTNTDPEEPTRQLDASGGQGLQIGEGNEQVNQYISTYVQHQIIDGHSRQPSSPDVSDAELKTTSSIASATNSQSPGTFSLRPPLGNLPVRIRGRDELIDRLQHRLEDRPDRIQVLHGLGGCGKTTVALGLARSAREHGYSVYWVSATGEDRLTTGMREVARELGASDDEINDAWTGLTSAMDLVWRYLDAAATPWLLVLDNADVPSRLAAYEGAPGDGTGWARPSGRGMTVITSRIGSAETWGQSAERYLVDVLSSDDGAEVLIDLAGQVGTAAEARNLAARLGGLPLALRLAGSYLARASRGAGILRYRHRGPSGLRTFIAYTDALGDLGTKLLDEGASNSSTENQLEHLHRQLISRTWEISLDLLHSQGLPEARLIMRLFSCFAAVPFPVDIIDMDVITEHGLLTDPTLADQVERAIEALVDFSLIDVTIVSDNICLVAHRVVLEANAHLLSQASPEDQSAVWGAAAGILRSATEPAPEIPANWERWRLLTPHIWAAVTAVPADVPDLVAEVIATGLSAFAYLWFSGNSEDATSLVNIMMMRSEKLEADHPVRLSIRHRYALANLRGEEVNTEFANILSAQQRVLGNEHQETLITHHNWAASLQGIGRLAEAETELRNVLDARRRVLGPADPYTLITQSAIAEVMAARGHSDEATSEYQSMIEHLESGKHSDHRFVPLEARHQMAHILDKAKKFAKAEVEYRSVLDELEGFKATESYLYSDMTICLSRNLYSQRRYSEALDEVDKGLKLLANLGGKRDRDTTKILRVRHERGDILRFIGQYDRAEVEIRAVLELRRQDSDRQDSVILQERHCLAHALEGQGRYADAESEMSEVVAAYESILGANSRPLYTAKYCYAMVLEKQGRWLEAEPQFEAVLAAEGETLGLDHSNTLVTEFKLAQVRHASGVATKEETLAIYDAILAKREEKFGKDHPRTREVRKERDRLTVDSEDA
jgi:tetratricopeptide (TPR) repeat protein